MITLEKIDSIEKLEEAFNFSYLPHLTPADWIVEQWVQKRCLKALKKDKVGSYAKWLGNLHYKELADPTLPDFSIRFISKEIGYGLFTNQPIAKWKFIGEYTGLLRFRKRLFPDINDYCFMYPREWISLRAVTIDSEKHGNYTRFINHSDHPNLESLSVFHDGIFHIMFRAIKDIPAGTELTYDYGDIYWNKRKKLPH